MRTYTMKKTQGTPDWSAHEILPIDHLLWTDSIDVTAQAQICYDDENFYLRLQAVEPHIRKENQPDNLLAEVCEDSCLEFFIQPTDRMDYLNFEINPNRAVYLGFGPNLPENIRQIVPEVQDLLDIQTELTADGWMLTYRVPFAFLRRYFTDFAPTKGTKIRANFYKCGDETRKMHFLAWNPIHNEVPAFHIPRDFGCLIFGE